MTAQPHSLGFIMSGIPRDDGGGGEQLTQEEIVEKAKESGLPLTVPQPSPSPSPAPKGRAKAAPKPKAAARGKKAAGAAVSAEGGKADHKADAFAAADRFAATKAAASPAKRKGGDKPTPAAKKQLA